MGCLRHAEVLLSPRRELRRLARVAGFGVLTGAMLPGLVVHEGLVSPDRREALRERWVGAWCTMLLRLFGVRVLMHGSPPPPGRGCLIVANHRSTADILVLLKTFGGHMVSRADLAQWPLVGVAARAAGTVFVDRSDVVSGANAVRAIRALLADRANVIVFPEGTTYAGDEVRPFHAGAFVAAARTGGTVVPVGLAYANGSDAAFVNESFPAHLARVAAARPSDVAMYVGDPIAVGDKARASQLRDRVHAEVQRLVHEARRMVDGNG